MSKYFRIILEFFVDIIFAIKAKIRYRKKLREAKKRDPYIYK